jgi:hypothetical protein
VETLAMSSERGGRLTFEPTSKAAKREGGMVRTLILSMGMSLDGLVARPGRFGAGGRGLPPEAPELKERKLGWLHDAACI